MVATSVQIKLSFILLIVLLQACLLHARSLRVERQITMSNGGSNDATTHEGDAFLVDSSCSPGQDQLEYYSKLYGANTATGITGSTLYYATRAMEAHNNRTVSTTTAAEDNAVIANISDQSRFTPAGMESANKVVCAQILQELDAVASVISNTALCPWDYICDYKADRYPHYLFKARCKTSMCSGNCNPEDNRHNMCQSHGIHVSVLQMRENCGEWVWGQELLPIACTCTHDLMK